MKKLGIITIIVALVAVGLLLASNFYEQQRGVIEAAVATHQLDSNSNYIAAKGIMVNDYAIWALRIIGMLLLAWCVYATILLKNRSRWEGQNAINKIAENKKSEPATEVEDQK